MILILHILFEFSLSIQSIKTGLSRLAVSLSHIYYLNSIFKYSIELYIQMLK